MMLDRKYLHFLSFVQIPKLYIQFSTCIPVFGIFCQTLVMQDFIQHKKNQRAKIPLILTNITSIWKFVKQKFINSGRSYHYVRKLHAFFFFQNNYYFRYPVHVHSFKLWRRKLQMYVHLQVGAKTYDTIIQFHVHRYK